MKNRHDTIMTSRWTRSFLLLTLAYLNLVSPTLYSHHFHFDGLLEFEISSNPVEVDGEHSSDHQHDGDSSHANDHQHNYDSPLDWYFIRPQSPRTFSIDNQQFLCFVPVILTQDNMASHIDDKELPRIDDYDLSSLIVRGPPLFA